MPKKSGFTLVELLVVISIIAVLSMVGITLYSGVQKNARDARRKTDIDAIANAMETNFGKTTPGQYKALDGIMFSSGGVPVDPSGPGTSCNEDFCHKYCAKASVGACGAEANTVEPGFPAAGTGYTVCASLENGTPNYYCRSAQQ